MTITEVGCTALKPGMDVMNAATPEGKILNSIWEKVIKNPEGPSRVYWGVEKNDPLKQWAWFDWDSVEHHEKFAKEHGEEAVKDYPKIGTHGEFTKHLVMTPSNGVLNCAVTEIMLIYFPANVSQTFKFEKLEYLVSLLESHFAQFPEVKGMGYGRGMEDDFPVRGCQDGELGSVLVGFVGWSSDDALEKARKTDVYNEAIHLIKSMEGIVSLYIFSTNCQFMERE